MSEQRMVKLALRILALFLIIRAFEQLSALVQMYGIRLIADQDEQYLTIMLVSLGPVLVFALAGAGIWIYSERWSRRFLGESVRKADAKESVSVRDRGETALTAEAVDMLFRAAIALAGIVIVVHTLPSVIRLIPTLMQANEIERGLMTDRMIWETRYALAEFLLKLMLGILLILGRNGISRLFGFMRNAGLPRAEETER